MNASPHCLATCFECGWQGGDSINASNARSELFKHLKEKNHRSGSLEVTRTSKYKLIT